MSMVSGVEIGYLLGWWIYLLSYGWVDGGYAVLEKKMRGRNTLWPCCAVFLCMYV